ncbi:MAG: thermonuclease family protein [Lentisphaerae bacterium]|nr:thermonuclease family protein [Lentisphaerota bacterium]
MGCSFWYDPHRHMEHCHPLKTNRIHVIWGTMAAIGIAGGFIGGYGLSTHQAAQPETRYPATCIEVIDGDTVRVVWEQGTNLVRLLGIDAPETRRTAKQRRQAEQLAVDSEWLREVGKTAAQLARVQVLGREVHLVFTTGRVTRDAFSRLLAYVEADGEDLGSVLVQNGLATPRDDDHLLRARYDSLNAQARMRNAGMCAGE